MLKTNEQLKHLLLTLVRHGQTSANKSKIIQGQSDTKLSDEGIDQSIQLSKHIDVDVFDLVFASDLSRAYDTCRTLVGQRKLIITDVRLRERSFGPLEGKTIDDLKREAEKHSLKITEYTPIGGETLSQVSARVKSFLNERLIKSINSGSRVLVVTHGGVIREMMRYFKDELNCDFGKLSPLIITPNTSVNEFRVYYDSDRIVSVECLKLHDISHLSEKNKSIVMNEVQINDNKPANDEHAV